MYKLEYVKDTKVRYDMLTGEPETRTDHWLKRTDAPIGERHVGIISDTQPDASALGRLFAASPELHTHYIQLLEIAEAFAPTNVDLEPYYKILNRLNPDSEGAPALASAGGTK